MAWDRWQKVKKQMAEWMELPGDVLMDLPRVVVVGNMQVSVENHRGIVEYTQEKVRISTGACQVVITGNELCLRNILPDEICVEGSIKSIEYQV
ncbi:MAG: sporulation protein YqfC [Bacillota bacterium]|uniref:sporulation protein YqfC n=1 Tax=Desulfurispora thermophila TaxID=265470 RepID=UPI00035EB701|nr:sporulation protein YqfC [Desulfurispora thermophila]